MPCFVGHFSKLADPRIERNKLHELMDIISLITKMEGGAVKPETDFYSGLGKIIEDSLIAREIEPELAASATVVAFSYGGQTVYLKNGLSGEIAMKHERIAAEYNGKNIRQLSMKYRVSVVWIKKILKKHGK